jgi:DeoR/GlpR family transcriptional regulator of sugar metabolism
MLIAERQRSIITIVTEGGSARVTELAKHFRVTEETIRRDLEKLESEGKLLRSHGGAVAPVATAGERHYTERQLANAREKSAIARLAVELISEGDTIVLDASSTVLQLARLLPDIDVTVLTNSIQVALALADRPRMRVVGTGGTLSSASLSFAGPQAEEALEKYFVNKAFLSCTGVDIDFGLSDINERQALFKVKMMDISARTYLLADHSKFGAKSLRRFSRIEDVDEIITDSELDADMLETIRRAGPTVIVAEL